MKLKIYFMALAGFMAFASCTDDDRESADEPLYNNVIRFSATTQRGSRAGDITTNNLTSFNVYAYLASSGSVFMDDVNVTKGSDNTWTYSPVKYWPEEALNFYAYAPNSWVPSTGPLEKVDYDNSYGLDDLVYAVSLGRTQPTSQEDAQVRFNFRHALSKFNMMISSANANISVKVATITLVGLSQKGSFSFPKASTDATGADVPAESVGTWSDLSSPFAYPVFMAQDQDEVLELTPTPIDPNAEGHFAQYIIQQGLAWVDGGDYTNSDYIQIDLSIYDPETGAKIWPNKNTPASDIVVSSKNGDGRIKFPVSTSTIKEWKPGYHYIYNVVINGHHDIGEIEFGEPTVDTFVEVNTDYDFPASE